MPHNAQPTQRALLISLFEQAIKAAQPARCLPPHLPPRPPNGRIVVLGAGKAAAAMALAAEEHYGTADALDAIEGFVTTRHGYAKPTAKIAVREAGHPIPDEPGARASRDTLQRAAAATASDLVLVLLSGGASALWSAPCAGVTLEDKQALTRQLLRAGARIGEMNCIRKHLSLIKGGRLATAATANGARLVTCAISDVPNDDPAIIGSGPTVGDPTTLADARAILERYGIIPPPAIATALLDQANETPKSQDPVFAGTDYRLVAAPAASLAAAAEYAQAHGYETEILGDSIEGEASEVAREHAEIARAMKRAGRKCAILSGGELTVTIKGHGRGGPNQEYALALAVALAGEPGITAIAGDTDGTDGGSGSPDDPAGAIVLEDCLVKAGQQDRNAVKMLADNDSTTFFDVIGDLVHTGPTQTNVNDFRAILVDGKIS
jgi:glycerate 2-kinase